MNKRLELHNLLCSILGSNNVYFQPPASVKMKYPAIVYSRNSIDSDYADDTVYSQKTSYQVIVIDVDPDGTITTKIAQLPTCKHNRFYVADNLNHDSFTLYY